MTPIICGQADVKELKVSSGKINDQAKDGRQHCSEVHELKSEEFAWFLLVCYGIKVLKAERPVK